MLYKMLPVALMISLSLEVLTWQHVVGHTIVSAHSMLTPPIILLASIAVCTGIVSYFITMSVVSLLRNLHVIPRVESRCNLECSSKYEYEYSFGTAGSAVQGEHLAGADSEGNSGGGGGPPTPEVLTLSMVWSGVYGLGVSTFCVSYIITMASTLATFSFLVGLCAVSFYQLLSRRLEFLQAHRAKDKSPLERTKGGLQAFALLTGVICISFMGVHIASVEMNMVGRISAVDVFMGIILPMLTPLLLTAVAEKCVFTPSDGSVHTISSKMILATWEVSLPFTICMCALFIISTMGTNVLSAQTGDHISRNIFAATTLMPFAWGLTMMCVLHAAFHKDMLVVFASFMLVASGREVTLYRSDPMVLCMFISSFPMYLLVWVAHCAPSVLTNTLPSGHYHHHHGRQGGGGGGRTGLKTSAAATTTRELDHMLKP